MGERTFMDKYPTIEEVIKDEYNRLSENDLIKIVEEPTLRSNSSSWRDWDEERENESKNSAILDYFKIDETELDRFELIDLGRISNHHSSVAQLSTYTDLYLVLEKETKIGYYLVHDEYANEGHYFS